MPVNDPISRVGRTSTARKSVSILRLNSAREVVTFWRLAFEDHCELCDAVQRRHGIAGEAVNGLLDSGSRKDRNAVGWLGTR